MKKILFIIILAVISFTAQAQFSARYSKLHIGTPGVDFKLVSNKSQAQIEGGGAFTLANPDAFTKEEVMALYKYFEEHKEEIEKKYNLIIARNSLNWVNIQYGNAVRPEIVIYDKDANNKYWEEYVAAVKDRKKEAKAKIENLFSK